MSKKYWLERAMQRDKRYFKNATKLNEEVIKMYTKAYKEIEKEIYYYFKKHGIEGKNSYSVKRKKALMKAIEPLVDKRFKEITNVMRENISRYYKEEVKRSTFDIVKEVGISPNHLKITESTIKKAIDYPWSGENFSDKVWIKKEELINSIRSEITVSLIKGENPSEPSKKIERKFDVAKKNAKMLVFTEVANIIEQATLDSYELLGVEKYEYVATLDNRTSETCRDLDGKVFKVSEAITGFNYPPMHPFCRSTTVPNVGTISKERIARDVKTGKNTYVREDITYSEWEKEYAK